ncbi:hypothetical protein [Mucilaginibacter sp.]|uniref:hypothetical protein n=1 Tax=Mucilaginibacter sp. TaxID=1882438 RepID=UPI00260A9AD9|nr:hypothetical protein [Mucilaginibacter sp.]MDB4927273.1 hypothetical protein [Mucilaginibacter sp.]
MKSNLKTVAALLIFSAIATVTKAQLTSSYNQGSGSGTIVDDAGNVRRATEYSGLVGSPYFIVDWSKADVTFADGSVQKDKVVKYDELKDKLFTQIKDDKMGEFDTPVADFTITAADGTVAKFGKIPGNGKFGDDAFFEILSDGKVKLIRKNAKSISEYKKDLGTAVTTREVVDNIDYYLVVSGKLVRIKKDKKSVEAALGAKQTELDAYIKSNNLNLKNDADLAKLITQYNTL